MPLNANPTRTALFVILCLAAPLAGCGDEPPPDDPSIAEAEGDAVTESEVSSEGEAEEPAAEAEEPSGPPKRIFAKRFVVAVRAEPNRRSERIGYLRAGVVMQATTDRPVGNETCRGGWYELTTGGFVCNRRDVIAFDGERLPEIRHAQPDLEAKLPYQYGFLRRNAPMYRRLPSVEEAVQFEGFVPPGSRPRPVAAPVAAANGETPAANEAAPVPGGSVAAEDGVPAQPPEAQPTEAAAAPPTPAPTPAPTPTAAPEQVAEAPPAEAPPVEADAGVITLDRLQGEEDSVVVRTMMRGFYVSLDRDFRRGPRRYWRTQANGFIPYNRVVTRDGSDFHGVELADAEHSLPVGFVMSRRTVSYEKLESGRFRRNRQLPGYHHAVHIVGSEEWRNRTYLLGSDGQYYRESDIRVIEAREPPDDVAEGERWIDVDLSKQSLVAYVGAIPVFVTLVSTGRIIRENVEGQDHRTPTGEFRISSKHLTHTMDGDNAFDGPYSVDDVPYVMYFQLAYALHSAFWHNGFGRPRSHGCVNLAPLDARWMFNWAGPDTPEGWHATYPYEENAGTRLFIHGETPKG